MNKKTKLLWGAVSLICLLSLVFNGVLLGRNNSSTSEGTIKQNDSISILKRQIFEQDTIISELSEKNQLLSEDLSHLLSEIRHAVRNNSPAERINTTKLKSGIKK